MSKCLSAGLPIFEIINLCNSSTYRSIILDKKLSKILLCALVELAYNLLYTDLPLTPSERATFRRKKNFLRELANKEGDKSSKLWAKKLELVRKNRISTKILIGVVVTGSLQTLKQCFENSN